jgi:hypothetical protein
LKISDQLYVPVALSPRKGKILDPNSGLDDVERNNLSVLGLKALPLGL